MTAQEAEQLRHATRLPEFGVAILDNKADMNEGWACTASGSPFYFSKLDDLANNVMWVASADWKEFQLKGRNAHNLRRADYLRTNLLRIGSDIGIRSEGQFAQQASGALARIVQGTVEIASASYGWDNPAVQLRQDVLSDCIRVSHPRHPVPKQHIQAPLLSAFQSNSNPRWQFQYEESIIVVTLRYNRLDYFRQLLQMQVPDESWTETYKAQALGSGPAMFERLLDPERPCLVEAVVELKGAGEEMAILAAFGAQSGSRNVLRRWISQPELRWLVSVARVSVQSAMVCQSAKPLPAAVQLPPRLVNDPLYSLSISAGLVAESHFHAVASQHYDRSSNKKSVSAWAVWMRAHDRARMFELARLALVQGFTPLVYGTGSLTVRLKRDRLADLAAFADEHGLSYPSMYSLFVEHGLVEHGDIVDLPRTPTGAGASFGAAR